MLGGVYAAQSLADALASRTRLAAHELIVTREGVQVGASWMRLPESGSAQTGVLSRERELDQLALQLGEQERTISDATAATETCRQALERAEEDAGTQARELAEQQEQRAALQSRLSELKARHEQAQQREAERQQRMADLRSRLQAEEQVRDGARARLARSSQEMQRIEGERSRWA